MEDWPTRGGLTGKEDWLTGDGLSGSPPLGDIFLTGSVWVLDWGGEEKSEGANGMDAKV